MITTRNEYLAAVKEATDAAYVYYQTGEDSGMTDADYDKLLLDIDLAGKAFGWTEGNDIVTKVAGGTKSDTPTVKHSVPMLSLDKLTSANDLSKFIELVGEKNLTLEPKLDGSAFAIVYKKGKLATAARRGDGHYGDNLTAKILASSIRGLPHTLPAPVDLEVRGELYITDSDFKNAQAGRARLGKKLFSNSRNAVSGAISDEKDNSYIVMTFGAYEAFGIDDNNYLNRMNVIAGYGFSPAVNLMPKELNIFTSMEEKIEAFGKLRPTLGFLTDGIVLKCTDYRIRASMGEGSHGPRYSKAWKYNSDEARGVTKLLDIEYTIGRTGRLSMIGILKPVQLDTLVSKVSLHNVKWIQERDLRIGSTVTILRRNGVIPYLEDVIDRPADSSPWVAPAVCPQCGEPFDKSTELWRCASPECSVLGGILFAGSRDVLDWDGFSGAVATQLVDSGRVNDISDMFTLTVKELANLDMGRVNEAGQPIRLGVKTAEKIIAQIEKSKQQPLARVITSLNIRKLGRTFGRRLAAHYGSMAKLQAASIADLQNVEGVAENKATEFYNGLKARRELISKLASYGVTMVNAPVSVAPVAAGRVTNAGAILAGKKIVVTGSMKGSKLDTLSRNDMTELIEKHGGTPSSAVSSSTNILVCAEAGSSKYQAAVKLGTVKIMSPNDFAALIGM